MVTDEQVRLLRRKRMEGKTQETAAAAAAMSVRTAGKWERGPRPRSRYEALFQPPDHPVTRRLTGVNHRATLCLQSRAFRTKPPKTSS